MNTISWVIGRGGLLGSAVERAISTPVWHPEFLFPWQDLSELRDSIADAMQQFRPAFAF